MIKAVFFDVGETSRGLDCRETFQAFRPGFDLAAERERRAQAGVPEGFDEENLYADARPCLSALRAQGLRVGLAATRLPARSVRSHNGAAS